MPIALALLACACDPDGALGAPCGKASDCDDGLMCDFHSGGGSCQEPHEAHDDEPAPRSCEIETRDDDYALGLAKRGTWADVQFVDALPAPPSRGDNTWTLHVTDHASAPLEDLDVGCEPFMPDHFHGTAIQCDVTPGAAAGHYVLTPVNLFMAGLWDVTVSLSDGAREDAVKFTFCVDP
jgi:hypothetical protein